MSTDLAELTADGPLAAVKTQHLFTMTLETLPILTVGATPNGLRRIGIVKGGAFAGDRLRGKVLGGHDWQLVRADGSLTLDVRLVLETEGGRPIAMSYRGLRHGPADVIQRIERGEVVDPASYYFRIAPSFEVDDPELAWLNGVLAIGIGHRLPHGPVYAVYEVL